MTSEDCAKLIQLREEPLLRDLKLLRNIAQRVVNFSTQLEQGNVRLEYQYAMTLSQLYKDALTALGEV